MKAHPILFSGPMVRALLADQKTQTRRVMKPQPVGVPEGAYFDRYNNGINWNFWTADDKMCNHITGAIKNTCHWRCPYGEPGYLLWVRETLAVVGEGFDYDADGSLASEITDSNADLWGRYGHEDGPDIHPTRIPSIFMPRWASRLTLRITDVRVQRLQDISEEDAKAEGSEIMWDVMLDAGTFSGPGDVTQFTARDTFRDYINLLNKKRGYGWETNPWMWAVSFEVIKANVDQILKVPA